METENTERNCVWGYTKSRDLPLENEKKQRKRLEGKGKKRKSCVEKKVGRKR